MSREAKYTNIKRFKDGNGDCNVIRLGATYGGDVALYLSFLILATDYYQDNKPDEIIDGYFPMTENYVEKQTLFGKRKQRRLKSKLTELGFIDVKHESSKYMLRQNWFKVNMDAIMAVVSDLDVAGKVSQCEDKNGHTERTETVTRRGQKRSHIYKIESKTISNSPLSPKDQRERSAPARSARNGDTASISSTRSGDVLSQEFVKSFENEFGKEITQDCEAKISETEESTQNTAIAASDVGCKLVRLPKPDVTVNPDPGGVATNAGNSLPQFDYELLTNDQLMNLGSRGDDKAHQLWCKRLQATQKANAA